MKYILIGLSLVLFGCGTNPSVGPVLPPVDKVQDDGAVVHGRAVVTVEASQETAMLKFIRTLFPYAYAASSGTTTVTYTNAASTNFTINVASLGATGFTGNTLNLGSVSVATLSDNNLKVCNPGGNTKCTNAAIRVYTTGSVAGFVNTTDLYGAPVYAGTLNPSSALGLTSSGAVNVQTLGPMSNSKHTVTLADFPTPTYSVTSDFSNAGAGSYSMQFVVEYVLLP